MRKYPPPSPIARFWTTPDIPNRACDKAKHAAGKGWGKKGKGHGRYTDGVADVEVELSQVDRAAMRDP